MSLIESPEMTEAKLEAQRANSRKSRGPVTRHGKANSAAANLRHGFYSTTRAPALLALGEDPEEYLKLMESLHDDLQPRPGLENLLVERMGETLWRMGRAQRMEEGLALKAIRSKLPSEELMLVTRAAKAIENLEPFENLDAALARAAGPTAEEIQAFIACRQLDASPQAEEFKLALKTLESPMEQSERRAACRKIRARLHPMMEGYRTAAWVTTSEANKTHSAENLAALMAPGDTQALLLQRREDADLRRLSRLADTLMKVRQGRFSHEKTKNEGRSHDLHENKGSVDKITERETTDCHENE